MSLKSSLLGLILLCMASSATANQVVRLSADDRSAANPAAALGFWEDIGQQARWSQFDTIARTGELQPLRAGAQEANFGASRSAFWLRFKARANGSEALPAVLEVNFNPLDSVIFHIDGKEVARTGFRTDFSNRPLAYRAHAIPLVLPADRELTIDIRIQTSGTASAPLRLWTEPAFREHIKTSYSLLALYFGGLIALALYSLLLFLSLQERSYLFYVLYIAGIGLGQLDLYGFGSEFIWTPGTLLAAEAGLLGWNLAGLFGTLFGMVFLNTRLNLPRLHPWLFGLALLYLLNGVLGLTAHWLAVRVQIYLGLFGGLLQLAGVWLAWRRHVPAAGVFLLSLSCVILGVLTISLRNLQWLPANGVTTNAMLIGSALQIVLLAFAQAHCIQHERLIRETAQAETLKARQSLVDMLQEKERELENKVQERTRSLQDAHDRLTASEQAMREMAHHDALTGLANRILLDDRLNQALLNAQRRQREVAVLLIPLDHFKPINDTFGHQAGDVLLVELARRMQGSLRQSDTLSRLGGDEFVIILQDLEPGAQLVRIFGDLKSLLATPCQWQGHTLQVSGSIGVARYPADGHTAQELMRCADERMYEIKRAFKAGR